MFSLYLRKEPTTDTGTLANARDYHGGRLTKRARDVVAYRDRECARPAGRWPWFYNSKPDRRNRYIMLNCYRWRAVWLPDVD